MTGGRGRLCQTIGRINRRPETRLRKVKIPPITAASNAATMNSTVVQ